MILLYATLSRETLYYSTYSLCGCIVGSFISITSPFISKLLIYQSCTTLSDSGTNFCNYAPCTTWYLHFSYGVCLTFNTLQSGRAGLDTTFSVAQYSRKTNTCRPIYFTPIGICLPSVSTYCFSWCEPQVVFFVRQSTVVHTKASKRGNHTIDASKRS